MGIKCFCPHGHPLNVKSHLAGKRGVCPTCGVKFRIPEASGSGVPSVSVAGSGKKAADPPEFEEFKTDIPHATSNVASPPNVNLAARDEGLGKGNSEPVAASKPAIWYVKTRDGQYGPTYEAAVQEWVADGRIVLGNWLWRDGWEQWRPAESVFSQLLPPPANSTSPGAALPLDAAPMAAAPMVAAPIVAPQVAKDAPHLLGRAALRQRQGAKRRRVVVICLSVVSIVLLAALLILVVVQ
ncbi:MAG: DUF4339 domain-containing protein [Planctomycetota bacterium]|nr:DUF4339 domain-containing protein [Planctomycetota bacterium]MDA1180037.1 DUF4339 domain-containing protein [Planctomycetota bacterium]